MRNWALGGILATAAIASASDVVQLNKDSFDDFIKTNDIVLAEFFAPWCGHCQALAPELEEAATSLKEKNIKLVKVDCTEEHELCKLYDVEGYPTLKLFKNAGEPKPYSGQRKAAAITSFMTKQSLPTISILTEETLEDLRSTEKVVVVSYFKASDKASNETYTQVAEKLRDEITFGATNDAALVGTDSKTPVVVVYKDFDEGKSVHTGEFDAESIEAFIKTAKTPVVGEVGPETYNEYMAANIPLAYIFAETEEARKKLAEELKPIAEAHRGAVNFATINAKEFGAHASNLNLKSDQFPAFAIQDVANNQKYPFDQGETITHDAIKAFVADFVAGKIEPSVKSEPIPETQEGPVTVVVAKSFDEIVLDDSKDVLLEFYAPWCGHCKSLAPKYERLATRFAASEFKDKIVIAKIDATANDVPVEVQGFPTIKLYPADAKKEPITFSGARTVEDLAKFVAENGKFKAVLPEEADETIVAHAATEDSDSKHDEL